MVIVVSELIVDKHFKIARTPAMGARLGAKARDFESDETLFVDFGTFSSIPDFEIPAPGLEIQNPGPVTPKSSTTNADVGVRT